MDIAVAYVKNLMQKSNGTRNMTHNEIESKSNSKWNPIACSIAEKESCSKNFKMLVAIKTYSGFFKYWLVYWNGGIGVSGDTYKFDSKILGFLFAQI